MEQKPQQEINAETAGTPSRIGELGKPFIVWAVVFLGCVGSLLYLVFGVSGPALQLPSDGPDWQRHLLFDEQVVPAIARCDSANRVAVNLCIKRIKDMFEKQRQGVPGFAEDMTSWGTRWSVVKRMPGRLVEREQQCDRVCL